MKQDLQFQKPDSAASQMRVRDFFLFQIGHGDAVRRIVATRWSLGVGLALVFTAAIARNYDQIFLPWHGERFAGPLIFPLVSSLLVFVAIWWSGTRDRTDETQPGFLRQYPGFLAAFLMTAPLAWIYAIPVEALADNLLTAAKWNVFFLALVSLWRVWLIARVAQVITGLRFFILLPAILVPASAEAFLISFVAEVNLTGMMGGILPPDEAFMARALETVIAGSAISFAASLLAMIAIGIVFWRDKPGWKRAFLGRWHPVPKTALFAALGIAVAWGAIALPGQRRTWNRAQAAQLIRAEDYDMALRFLRNRTRQDFPPGKAFFGPSRSTDSIASVEIFDRLEPDDPEWLIDEFLHLARDVLTYQLGSRHGYYPDSSRKLISQAARLPGGRKMLQSLAEEFAPTIDFILEMKRQGLDLREEALPKFISDLEEAGVDVPAKFSELIPPTPPGAGAGDTETSPAN